SSAAVIPAARLASASASPSAASSPSGWAVGSCLSSPTALARGSRSGCRPPARRTRAASEIPPELVEHRLRVALELVERVPQDDVASLAELEVALVIPADLRRRLVCLRPIDLD